VTEIYHFLRLLYAKLGTQHCPVSGLPVVSQTLEAIHKQITESLKTNKASLLLVPLVIAKKGYHTDIVTAAERHGITQVIADGKLINTSDFTPLARYKEHLKSLKTKQRRLLISQPLVSHQSQESPLKSLIHTTFLSTLQEDGARNAVAMEAS